MSDINKDDIQELKALRAELLSEYDEKINDVSSTEEAVLLRQELMEEYEYRSDDSSQLSNENSFSDEESEGSDAPVKTLTDGRSI